MKIFLAGNPNVGKSVLFNRLASAGNSFVSNYPGTTVDYFVSSTEINGREVEVIDLPGVYSLEGTNEAEEVALKILKDCGEEDLVINVIDATRIRNGLFLTLSLIEKGYPLIVAVNMMDVVRKKGMEIDLKALEESLGVPVVGTVAISGEGVDELISRIEEGKKASVDVGDKWAFIDRIVARAVRCGERKITLLDKIDEVTLNPLVNLAIAFVVLYCIFTSFLRVGHIFLTEGLIGKYIFAQQTFYDVLIHRIFEKNTFLYEIMVGNTNQGYLYSFGLLTTGLYIALGVVLPAIFIFYAWLTVLEDIGYLPRLTLLADIVLSKIGLSGTAIIPTILGMGCNVPGMAASRIVDSSRQKFILANILAIAVPCTAQLSVALHVIGGMFGLKYLIFVFFILILLYGIIGALLDRVMERGSLSEELIMEIPPYRRPMLRNIVKKLEMRMRSFLFDALPWIIVGVLIVNVLYQSGLLGMMENAVGPFLAFWLGIPPEMVGALIVGFLRKDVAIAFFSLIPGMNAWQAVTGVVILMIYFPCVATFVIMFKELGFLNTLKSTILMIAVALVVGGLLHGLSILFGVF